MDIQRFFGAAWAPQIAADLRALTGFGFSGAQMACTIQLMAQARTAEASAEGAIDLVTTGPFSLGSGRYACGWVVGSNGQKVALRAVLCNRYHKSAL